MARCRSRRSARSRTTSPPSCGSRASSPPSSWTSARSPTSSAPSGAPRSAPCAPRWTRSSQDMRERFRQDDFITRDEREGDRFLLFLSGPRRGDTPFRSENLRKLVERVEEFLNPRVGRLTLPVPQGAAGARRRLRARAVEPPREPRAAGPAPRGRRRSPARRCGRGCATASSASGSWRSSRTARSGPRSSRSSSSGPGARWAGRASRAAPAARTSSCRSSSSAARPATASRRSSSARAGARRSSTGGCSARPAGSSSTPSPPPSATPASSGRGVLDYLGPELAPSAVTLEITERQVIENLNLYREAMHSFTDLGFSFAIDDVGAGYSGLETVAALKPAYLKIDIALVRDVHQKKVSQQVVKAILDMGEGLGATVIAEGIQTREEVRGAARPRRDLGPGLLLRPAGGPLRRAAGGPRRAERGTARASRGARAPPPRRPPPRVRRLGRIAVRRRRRPPRRPRRLPRNPCTAALAATGGVAASAAGALAEVGRLRPRRPRPARVPGAAPPAPRRRASPPAPPRLPPSRSGDIAVAERRRLDRHRREPLRPRRGRASASTRTARAATTCGARAAASAPTSAGGSGSPTTPRARSPSPSPSPSTAPPAPPPS